MSLGWLKLKKSVTLNAHRTYTYKSCHSYYVYKKKLKRIYFNLRMVNEICILKQELIKTIVYLSFRHSNIILRLTLWVFLFCLKECLFISIVERNVCFNLKNRIFTSHLTKVDIKLKLCGGKENKINRSNKHLVIRFYYKCVQSIKFDPRGPVIIITMQIGNYFWKISIIPMHNIIMTYCVDFHIHFRSLNLSVIRVHRSR